MCNCSKSIHRNATIFDDKSQVSASQSAPLPHGLWVSLWRIVLVTVHSLISPYLFRGAGIIIDMHFRGQTGDIITGTFHFVSSGTTTRCDKTNGHLTCPTACLLWLGRARNKIINYTEDEGSLLYRLLSFIDVSQVSFSLN